MRRLIHLLTTLRVRLRRVGGALRIRHCAGAEWAPLPWTGARMGCCDCGLMHTYDFKMDPVGRLTVRASRDVRATYQLRTDPQRQFPYQRKDAHADHR